MTFDKEYILNARRDQLARSQYCGRGHGREIGWHGDAMIVKVFEDFVHKATRDERVVLTRTAATEAASTRVAEVVHRGSAFDDIRVTCTRYLGLWALRQFPAHAGQPQINTALAKLQNITRLQHSLLLLQALCSGARRQLVLSGHGNKGRVVAGVSAAFNIGGAPNERLSCKMNI